jgi:hypothetical protein
MSDGDNLDLPSMVIDSVNDAKIALANAVLFRAAQLFAPMRTGIARKRTNSLCDARQITPRQRAQSLFRRTA